MYALLVRIEVDHAKQFNYYFFFLNKILQVKHKVDNVVPSMIMAIPITLRMYTTNKEVKPILWLSAVEFSLSQINDN